MSIVNTVRFSLRMITYTYERHDIKDYRIILDMNMKIILDTHNYYYLVIKAYSNN
jgi:hypothetical protein